jgi:hypothetical protein
MDLSEMAMVAARALAKEKDDYLRPFIEAGLNPDDYVLEQGPIVSVYKSDFNGVLTLTQEIRLRPKTDEERAL